MTTKKILNDFENEEKFLHYLSGEIEEFMMNASEETQNKIESDDDIVSYDEFFLANEPEEDYTIYKDLLYRLAEKYLNYTKDDLK